MKAVIVSALLALLTLFMVTSCPGQKKPAPGFPTTSTGLRTSIGDGSWIVGDELAVGLWAPEKGWDSIIAMKDCAWFVSPAKTPTPGATPTAEPSFRDANGDDVITLHAGESFTTIGCGKWVLK
jgi:hypothetical protein